MPRNPHLAALQRLAARDDDIKAALAAIGPPPPRNRSPGFESLLRTIVGQQISAAAAASLWNKLAVAINPLTPEIIARHEIDALRALGLSRQKAQYARGLAADILDGRVDLMRLHALEDEAAIEHLTQVKGIGRWSAEIYLLFALGRPDVWPSGDLALAIAAQRLKRLKRRPDPKRLVRIAESWRPYRGAAAHFLWHFYAKAPPL